ncbi:MAG: hypothetical protein ACRESZ_18835 [Methylococcales bacterium]
MTINSPNAIFSAATAGPFNPAYHIEGEEGSDDENIVTLISLFPPAVQTLVPGCVDDPETP